MPNLLDNLVLCYEFAETTGTAIADAHTGGKNATANSSVSTVTGHIDATAVVLTSNPISRLNDSDLVAPDDALTVAAWVNLGAVAANYTVAANCPNPYVSSVALNWWLKRNHTNSRWAFRWANGTNFKEVESLVSVVANQWYLVTAGYSQANDYLWISVDGENKITLNNNYTWGQVASYDDLFLGILGSTNAINGRLDQFALWHGRELTQADIAELYNSGSGLAYSSWTASSSPSIARKSIFLGMGLTIHGQGAGSSGTTVVTPEWELVGKALYHNGELFPIKGYYYDTNYDDPANATVDSHFTTLAATGANVIYTNVSSTTDDKIQECRDRNIYMILEENGVAEAALAAALASDPVLMAMYIFDDMDNGTHTVGDITTKVSQRNAAFPNKLTYGSTGTASPGTYSGYVDLQGHQTYSFAGNGEVEGGWLTVMDYPGDLVDASTIPFFLNNLQLYSDGSGYPDADQVRAMHYQAMIRGAIGTVAYSGWGGGGNEDAVNSAALMAEMTELFSEFDLIYEILMLGTRNRLTPSAPSTACYWETDTQVLFIAHNYADRGTGNDGASVSVTIPTGLSNKAKLASRYNDTFTYTSGTGAMSGSLDEEEVQIFLFDK